MNITNQTSTRIRCITGIILSHSSIACFNYFQDQENCGSVVMDRTAL